MLNKGREMYADHRGQPLSVLTYCKKVHLHAEEMQIYPRQHNSYVCVALYIECKKRILFDLHFLSQPISSVLCVSAERLL